MAEDTQAAGSRVAMHDSSMFDGEFNDDYDTVPDANFRFIYNLCTVFQPE